MTEVAREAMTSDASQTSSFARQQEDAFHSLQCYSHLGNPVFQIFFKLSANLALVNQTLTFKLKPLQPPPQHFLPGGSLGQQPPENSKHFAAPSNLW